MKKLLFLSIILPVMASSQTVIPTYALKSRLKADSLASKLFGDSVLNTKYIVFSVAERFFIFEFEKPDSLKECFVELNVKGKIACQKTKTFKKDSLKVKMFDKNNYRTDFTTFESDFYKHGYQTASGGTTYFVLKDFGERRFGESTLSVFVKPNPIPTPIYFYFVERFQYYIRLGCSEK